MKRKFFVPTPEPVERIEKRGRKAIKLTIALSQFYAKDNSNPPRKEFLRCTLFRRMIKMVKSILIDRARIIMHPSYTMLCALIKANTNDVTMKIERSNLPFVDNKKNQTFRSYNNAFCREFLRDDLMRNIFLNFLEVLFSTFKIIELQKTIGVYCCQGPCADEGNCRLKYYGLQQVILEDFLGEIPFS